MAHTNQGDFHAFLMESHRIATAAQFVIDSLPNAEVAAVERAIRQLKAVETVLVGINDELLAEDDLAELLAAVHNLLTPLEFFIANPPPPASAFVNVIHTGRPGRPALDINIDRAYELHHLGNTWDAIAMAMGTCRKTLQRHLERAGLSSARKIWSVIDDDELDAIVGGIGERHPFIGTTIMMGHLESQGIHVSRQRVLDSLKRVDAQGVLIR